MVSLRMLEQHFEPERAAERLKRAPDSPKEWARFWWIASCLLCLVISGLACVIYANETSIHTTQAGKYTVMPGDTLDSIAAKVDSKDYTLAVQQWIAGHNPQVEGPLIPGMVLKVPRG